MSRFASSIAVALALSTSGSAHADLWPHQTQALHVSSERLTQRARYQQALDELARGNRSAFSATRESLENYPLYPYLTYHDYRSRLNRVTGAEIRVFRTQWPDVPVGERLYSRWMYRQGVNRRWKRFLEFWEPRDSADLQCLYLRAMYGTGKREAALDQVAPLWTVGRSQPKVCDPLFAVWLQTPRLTQALVWRRLNLALDANQRLLARYLQRFFKDEYKIWGKALYDVHTNPHLVRRYRRYSIDSQLSRSVIAHGIRRLAARDAQAATETFQRYRTTHAFAPATLGHLKQYLLIANAEEGRFPEDADPRWEPSTVSAIADAAVARENWEQIGRWVEALPVDERERGRWRYWYARSLESRFGITPVTRDVYAGLATKRSYYGFLAAHRLRLPPRLNEVQAEIDSQSMIAFRRIAAVRRTEELIAAGDEVNTRREWFSLTPTLTEEQGLLWTYLLAAKDEARLAIMSANTFDLHDHIRVRFPTPYRDPFAETASDTGVPVARLMAMARQESAFDATARSGADARGLIQILHSTARLAARRAKLPEPALADLYQPKTNIQIAGHHLAWLLRRYQDAFPIAIAAYNAGEHKVDRWIRDASGTPMDVWIENIPYRETRNYVKNVLAFMQVYGLLLGDSPPLLAKHEEQVP